MGNLCDMNPLGDLENLEKARVIREVDACGLKQGP